MRLLVPAALTCFLVFVSAARAQTDATAEHSEIPTVIIDSPADPVKPPARDGFNFPVEQPAPLPAVRARLQSRSRGVSFFLQGGTVHSGGVGAGPSYSVGVDRAGVTHRPGFGVYTAKTVTRGYELVCQAPCEVSIASGHHSMALSLDGGIPVPVEEPVALYRSSIVDGRYINRAPMRKAGWAVFGAGFIAGVIVMIAGLDVNAEGGFESVTNGALFGAGLALMGASIVIGVPMLTRDDRAHIRVYPME